MKLKTATIERLRDALLQSGRRPSLVLSSAYETLTREGMLSPEEASALHRVDPLAEAMFLMMSADGVVTEVERDAVRGAIRGLTNDVLRSGTITVMLETYAARLLAQGRDARLRELAEALADEQGEAEAAFALCAAVALADDSITEEENAFINQLAEWFAIPAERTGQLLDQLEAETEG
jgi:uncharacterized tellurite resistance protein B-like protein